MNPNNGRIKIAHCTWATGIGGGVGRMDAYLHRFLDREKFDLRFIAVKSQKPGEVWFDGSVDCVFTGDTGRFDTLVKFFSDVDIVQFQGGFDPLVCEAARACGVPALVEVMHSVEQGQFYPYIDATVCVSNAVMTVQPDKARARLIYNGIDLAEFPFAKRRDARDRIVILQAANRDKVTFNLDELADLLLPLDPRIELWIAGNYDHTKFTSTERVKHFGLRHDIAVFYRQADFMLLLTKREAFGLVAAEAMASGCVPIVSNFDGPAEIVDNGVNGFTVNPADKGAVVAAVKEGLRLLESGGIGPMRDNGRKKVEDRFTAQRCVEEYEKIYHELLGVKGRRIAQWSGRAEPGPDVDVADSVFYFKSELWEPYFESLAALAKRNGALSHPLLAKLALRQAANCTERGRVDIAEGVYRKVFESGFRGVEWMTEWKKSAKDGGMKKFIEDQAGIYVMSEAESLIGAGKVAETLELLRKGMEACPSSAEIAEVYRMLAEKLGQGG